MPFNDTVSLRPCAQCGRVFGVQAGTVLHGRTPSVFCSRTCYYASRRVTPATLLSWTRFNGECWEWIGKINPYGYGTYVSNGRVIRASRTAFSNRYGSLPSGLLVCHTCDNRACIRNDGPPGVYVVNGIALPRFGHLFLATHQQNTQDMLSKGRHGAHTHPERVPRGERHKSRINPNSVPRGEQHRNAKVTAEQVREIRRRYAAGGVTMARLGIDYGLKKSMVGNIVNRTSWRHVA